MLKAKFLSGNSFKRLDIEGLLSDPQWKKYLYKLYPKNLKVLLDSMQNRNMGLPLRVAILSLVIPENGGSAAPHGNGAHGLIGWRGGREEGLINNLPKQIHRIMDDTYNNLKYKEWTHGGKGTRVKTGKEMQLLFRGSPNTVLATNAFMKGYVRPPREVMLKRIHLANLIQRYMK